MTSVFLSIDYGKWRQLDWGTCYHIIERIAQGIRVIHCDLKANSILLNKDMNPKVQDFDMAKIFGVDQTQESTSRRVVHCKYMINSNINFYRILSCHYAKIRLVV